eukprot:m.88775 g.88775  ORF g.88775 m.88775 type:complete len:155 (-) comp12867_c0_seq7:169-633(-)
MRCWLPLNTNNARQPPLRLSLSHEVPLQTEAKVLGRLLTHYVPEAIQDGTLRHSPGADADALVLATVRCYVDSIRDAQFDPTRPIPPLAAPRSSRFVWFDFLPPYSPGFTPGPSAPANILAILRQLQAFACSHITSTTARSVLDVVSQEPEVFS